MLLRPGLLKPVFCEIQNEFGDNILLGVLENRGEKIGASEINCVGLSIRSAFTKYNNIEMKLSKRLVMLIK